MTETKQYIKSAKSYCALINLLYSAGYVRVHTASFPSVSGFKAKDAVALLEPYAGKYGIGYRLIIRVRGKANDRVTYFVLVQSIGQKGK